MLKRFKACRGVAIFFRQFRVSNKYYIYRVAQKKVSHHQFFKKSY